MIFFREGITDMSKTALKYSIYSAISIVVLSLPFFLAQIEFFTRDLNGLAVLLVAFPLAVFVHGIISALILKGRARLVYIVAVPICSVPAAALLILLLDTNTLCSFKNYLNTFAGLFSYPLFIFTLGVIISGWLGMIAVWIFRKLKQKSDAMLSKSKRIGR